MRGLVIVAAALLLAAGCSDDASESTAPPVYPGAGIDCPTDKPRPITAELARKALTDSGFSVWFDEGACGLGEVSGMLSNSSSSPGVMKDEGVVVCFLLVRPRAETPPDVAGDTGGARAERSLANLSCDLYADGVPADEEVARFERAFADLREQIS